MKQLQKDLLQDFEALIKPISMRLDGISYDKRYLARAFKRSLRLRTKSYELRHPAKRYQLSRKGRMALVASANLARQSLQSE